jgi:glycosyltransferase involved in cell wall biosynthesis
LTAVLDKADYRATGVASQSAVHPGTVRTGVQGGTSAPLRVLGVDPERRFAGGESQVMGLTLELIRAGHRAELLCDPEGELNRRAQQSGIICRPLRIRNSLDFAAGLRLRKLLWHERYDVVHFHTARAHALAPFARGLVPALVVTRRMDYPPNRLSARWLFNLRVDGVAAISESVADALARSGVNRDRIAIIPSGVDCDRFRPPRDDERRNARAALGLGPGEVAAGAVGMLEPRKGHRFLLEAIALWVTDGGMAAGAARDEPAAGGNGTGRLRCFIAGEGSLRAALESRVNQLGLDAHVRLTGHLADPRELLWALDIFAMPSLKEGLGVAALEAMACGLPVVASDVGGLREAVEPGRTGLLVTPGEPGALAAALRQLGDAPQRRIAMGEAARLAAVERFGMAVMARRNIELYRACLRGKVAERG